MTHGSLFSGIGGFDLGLERAGMVCKWQVEIDNACQSVLATHWPGIPRYGDIHDVGRHNLEEVDVITGGFPCQDLSCAGKRKGLAGERSKLFFEYARVIREIRPPWIVVENVPGLFSSNKGEDFVVVLETLAECGYGITWRVLDSQYFRVAQRRRRVFIVGSLGNGGCAEVLFEREGLSWDTAPRREAGQELTRDVAASIRNRGEGTGARIDNETGLVVAGHCTGQGWWNQSEIAGTLRAEGENRPSRPSNIIAYQCHGNNIGPMGTLRSGNAGLTGGIPFIADFITVSPYADNEAQHRKLTVFDWQTQGTERTFITRKGNYAQMRKNARDAVCGNFGVRRLTPTECERLQGFPDGWTAGQSDSARYRQLGNAVTVPVIEWIGRRIADVE